MARRESEPQLLAFKNTTKLADTGLYRHIRHPLYSSLFLPAWGIYFSSLAWHSAVLVLAAAGFLLATAKADEAECIRFFGPEYEACMRRIKRFIPFLFWTPPLCGAGIRNSPYTVRHGCAPAHRPWHGPGGEGS